MKRLMLNAAAILSVTTPVLSAQAMTLPSQAAAQLLHIHGLMGIKSQAVCVMANRSTSASPSQAEVTIMNNDEGIFIGISSQIQNWMKATSVGQEDIQLMGMDAKTGERVSASIAVGQTAKQLSGRSDVRAIIMMKDSYSSASCTVF